MPFLETIPGDSPDNVKIKNISFNILNYKGPINIGIKEAVDISTDFSDLIIEIKIQALSEPENQVCLDFDPPRQIDRNNMITFQRALLPMRYNAGPIKYEVFDSEHFTRDGVYLIPKLRLEDKPYYIISEFFESDVVRAIMGKNYNLFMSLMADESIKNELQIFNNFPDKFDLSLFDKIISEIKTLNKQFSNESMLDTDEFKSYAANFVTNLNTGSISSLHKKLCLCNILDLKYYFFF